MRKRLALTIAAVAAILLLQLGLIYALPASPGFVIPAVLIGTNVLIGLVIRGWLYESGERHLGRWAIGLLVFGQFALAVLVWSASDRFAERRRWPSSQLH